MNTIILYDEDAKKNTAVIKTKESVEKISDIIYGVKKELEGEWSFDDILQGLMDSGIDYEIYPTTTIYY